VLVLKAKSLIVYENKLAVAGCMQKLPYDVKSAASIRGGIKPAKIHHFLNKVGVQPEIVANVQEF